MIGSRGLSCLLVVSFLVHGTPGLAKPVAEVLPLDRSTPFAFDTQALASVAQWNRPFVAHHRVPEVQHAYAIAMQRDNVFAGLILETLRNLAKLLEEHGADPDSTTAGANERYRQIVNLRGEIERRISSIPEGENPWLPKLAKELCDILKAGQAQQITGNVKDQPTIEVMAKEVLSRIRMDKKLRNFRSRMNHRQVLDHQIVARVMALDHDGGFGNDFLKPPSRNQNRYFREEFFDDVLLYPMILAYMKDSSGRSTPDQAARIVSWMVDEARVAHARHDLRAFHNGEFIAMKSPSPGSQTAKGAQARGHAHISKAKMREYVQLLKSIPGDHYVIAEVGKILSQDPAHFKVVLRLTLHMLILDSKDLRTAAIAVMTWIAQTITSMTTVFYIPSVEGEFTAAEYVLATFAKKITGRSDVVDYPASEMFLERYSWSPDVRGSRMISGLEVFLMNLPIVVVERLLSVKGLFLQGVEPESVKELKEMFLREARRRSLLTSISTPVASVPKPIQLAA